MAPVGLTDKQFEALAQTVRQRESGGNYQLVSEKGYVGAYQFSAAQLVDVGYVNRNNYTTASTSSTYNQKDFIETESNWTIKGGLPVFLQNQALQDSAFEALMNRNRRQLVSLGALNADSSPFETAGMLGASHLLGPNIAANWREGGNIEFANEAAVRFNESSSSISSDVVLTTQSTGVAAQKDETATFDLTPGDALPTGQSIAISGNASLDESATLPTVENAPIEPALETFEDAPTQEVTAGIAATGKKQSFTQKLDNVQIDEKPNPLSEYATYTYNLSLYMMGVKGYVDLMRSNASSPLEAVNSTSKVLVARSGGIGKPLNEQFDIDFFIDALSVTNVGSPNRSAANTNAVDIKFEIYEPRGITLLERLKDASDQFGEDTNYVNTPYLLQIDFKGYDDEGRQINQRILPRFIPIKIVELSFEITASGAAYKITAVPFHHSVFSSINNTIPLNVQVKATTVGDIFSSSVQAIEDERTTDADGEEQTTTVVKGKSTTLAAAITEYNRKLTQPKRENKGGPPNQDIITPAEAELYDEVEFNPGGEIANSLLVTDKFDALNTDMKEAGDAFRQYAGAIKGKVQLEDNQIFRINAGTGIVSLLNFVVIASNYMERNVREENAGSGKGQNTPVYWWKIKPKLIDVKGWDKKAGRYKYKVRYDVIPTTVFYSDYPWAPKSKPAGEGYHKRYEYIYTGLNTEVLGFKLDFNTAYYQANQFGTGVPDGEQQDAKTSFPVAKQTITQSTESENLKSDTSVESKRSKDLLGTIMSEGADLVELKLDILGDPDYIPTGDGFFQKEELANRLYTEPYWPDGTINYDLTIPHVQVNFKTPTEYNDLTGLADPTVDKKYSASEFSGIYKVIEVRSTFQGGAFTQKLNLVRTKTQPDENGQIEQNSYAEAFDPGVAAKSVKKEPPKTIAVEKRNGEDQYTGASAISGDPTLDETVDRTPNQPLPVDPGLQAAVEQQEKLRNQELVDTGTEFVNSEFDSPPPASTRQAASNPQLENQIANNYAEIERNRQSIQELNFKAASGNLSAAEVQIVRSTISGLQSQNTNLYAQNQNLRNQTTQATGYPSPNEVY